MFLSIWQSCRIRASLYVGVEATVTEVKMKGMAHHLHLELVTVEECKYFVEFIFLLKCEGSVAV